MSKKRKKGKIDKNLFNLGLQNYIDRKDEMNTFLISDTERYVLDWLKSSITKTQMRNVFDLINNCKTVEELLMTKPKLVYTAGRLSGEGKYFLFELSKLVAKIKNESQMEAMQKFMETILAYHKYHS